jgi:hypothetical protein
MNNANCAQVDLLAKQSSSCFLNPLVLRVSAPQREFFCVLAVMVALANVRADDHWLPAPVSILISDDQAASPGDLSAPAAAASVGPSPYAHWPGQGQPPAASREDRLAEIHPQDADWINAAYAGLDYRSDAHCRAGWPECVRPRAIPSDTGRYCGYAVGGGAVLHRDGRYLDEGTWGWDYLGLCFRKRVALDWWHGRYQGGAGQYQTDGPKLRHE